MSPTVRQNKDNDAAIAGCTRVIDDSKVKPKGRADAYYNRGNAHSAKGDFAAAIADYDEAIKLDPKNASALTNRGTAHSEKGDADAAVADFDEAIKRNPRFASAYFNRANAYAARADADRAIADYTSSIRYDRRNVNAYIARGALYLAGGAVPKARADMALAARLDRKNAYAVLWQDIAERRAKQKGVLPRGAKGLDMKAWPAPVIRLFVGEIKQDAVLSAADDANPTVKQAHTCEANFYGGAIRADRGTARRRRQAVRGRRERLSARISRRHCGDGRTEGDGPEGRSELEQRRREMLHLDARPLADQLRDALAMAMCNVALIAQQAHRPA